LTSLRCSTWSASLCKDLFDIATHTATVDRFDVSSSANDGWRILWILCITDCAFAVELAPPVVLMPPSVARSGRLIDISIAVQPVPLLGVVRERERVLCGLSVEEATGWMPLDYKVVSF
jgi:hypothetical protein